MDRPLPDELLCESCGYRIAGLPTTGACPECGEMISRSLPDFRNGLPFQNNGRWWTTSFAILFEPRASFREVRIETQSGFSYCRRTLVTSAAIVGGCGSLASLAGNSGHGYPLPMSVGDFVVVAVLAGGVAFLMSLSILAVLTAIECWGIRIVGRRRGWRITSAVAWTICDFASVGWLIGSVLFAAGVCAIAIPLIALRPESLSERATAIFAATITLGSAAIGLFTFETLVYIGVRQCRFANPPIEAHDRAIAPTDPPGPVADPTTPDAPMGTVPGTKPSNPQ